MYLFMLGPCETLPYMYIHPRSHLVLPLVCTEFAWHDGIVLKTCAYVMLVCCLKFCLVNRCHVSDDAVHHVPVWMADLLRNE